MDFHSLLLYFFKKIPYTEYSHLLTRNGSLNHRMSHTQGLSQNVNQLICEKRGVVT